jgi:SIR2-like domain
MAPNDLDPPIAQYRSQISGDLAACVSKMGCSPILFVGSGLSRRYFSGPSWDELLDHLAAQCPLIDRKYAYYKQTLGSPLLIGKFARLYQEWAWGQGRNQFPDSMFDNDVPPEAYIKYKIAEHLKAIAPAALTNLADHPLALEINALRAIKPHAIITTNYDQFLELLFPDYQPIIGQKVIAGSAVLYGELFKIHGCVSEPNSLVFTQQDYEVFIKKKKYLSAKLTTFFSEHPLLFIGYSASDQNIRGILSDIDEILSATGTIIPNVYIIEWNESAVPIDLPAREKLVEIEGGRSVRIKAIETNSFQWVFEALAAAQPVSVIPLKLLRALLHRAHDIKRYDVPKQIVEVNFKTLEHAVESGQAFANLLGITTVDDPTRLNADFPHTSSMLAEHLFGDYNKSTSVNALIKKLKQETGIDLKVSDNRYHILTKTGKKSSTHKYSDTLLILLEKMRDGKPYDFKLEAEVPSG